MNTAFPVMGIAEDIDYDRMPHKRAPYNLPRQEVDQVSYFDSIYADTLLPPRAVSVYMYLKDRCNSAGSCWPRYQDDCERYEPLPQHRQAGPGGFGAARLSRQSCPGIAPMGATHQSLYAEISEKWIVQRPGTIHFAKPKNQKVATPRGVTISVFAETEEGFNMNPPVTAYSIGELGQRRTRKVLILQVGLISVVILLYEDVDTVIGWRKSVSHQRARKRQ